MPKYTQKELEERYQKLPEVLKDALFSVEVANKIFETGKKYGLTIEKTGFLGEETGYVILGLTRPREFVQILSDRLEADEDEAREIASDINHQIFFPIREQLKSAHQLEISEEEIQKAEAVIKKPVISERPTAPAVAKPKIPPLDLRQAVKPQAIKPEAKPAAPTLVKPPEPAKPAASPEKPPAPVPGKPPEPIKPFAPPPQPKIPPVDLRRAPKPQAAKPEFIHGAIFAAPAVVKSPPAPTPPPKEATAPEQKKAPSGEYDPYRETVE